MQFCTILCNYELPQFRYMCNSAQTRATLSHLSYLCNSVECSAAQFVKLCAILCNSVHFGVTRSNLLNCVLSCATTELSMQQQSYPETSEIHQLHKSKSYLCNCVHFDIIRSDLWIPEQFCAISELFVLIAKQF